MGVVYHARHEPLQRQVALKLIAPALSADADFRTRFQRECRAAASIRHPHVLPVYHAGEEDELLYVTMQYVEGADLGRILALEHRLAPASAALLVADLADAVEAAHRSGIVHRDVKPTNVLIEHRGEAMHAFLTDFGLAKAISGASQLTSTGMILGTLDYAAPEQLEELDVDARADVYALGCLLFHALTGAVPFPRATSTAKILAHLQTAPPPISSLVADVPAALQAVVARAMAKRPEDRYQSAGELGGAARAAVGAPTAAGDAQTFVDRARQRAVRDPRPGDRRSGLADSARAGQRGARGAIRRAPGDREAPYAALRAGYRRQRAVRRALRRARCRQDADRQRVLPPGARCRRVRALRPMQRRVGRPLRAVHHGDRAVPRPSTTMARWRSGSISSSASSGASSPACAARPRRWTTPSPSSPRPGATASSRRSPGCWRSSPRSSPSC